MIDKVLNFVWVGDDSLLPVNHIKTWEECNPDCKIKVWGNEDLENETWILSEQMSYFIKEQKWHAVADLMRWEILFKYGGVTLDADSIALRPLPEWIFNSSIFTCWENEYVKPGLLAAGYVGAVKNHPIFAKIIEDISNKKDLTRKFNFKKMRFETVPPWKTTGPVPFTKAVFDRKMNEVTILPSHFFIPVHHTGLAYVGSGDIYSCELFGSTHSSYSSEELTTAALKKNALDFIANARSMNDKRGTL